MTAHVPSLLALLLCDQVIEDSRSGNKSIIGLFNRLWAPSFPVVHPQLTMFAALTDGRGQTEIGFRIINEEDDSELFSDKRLINFPNPLSVADIVFNIRGLRFAKPGGYAAELYAASSLIARRRFTVAGTGKKAGSSEGS